MRYTLSDIAGAIGASPLSDGLGGRTVDTLLTDSRSLAGRPSTTLFFALSTAAGDGHRYLRELYDRGVRAFVVSRRAPLPPDATQLVVADTLSALQALARHHRQSLPGLTVIGVTGSRGKTVVKEWLAQLLAPEHPGLARSPRSFNSQIGVPLSLWGVAPGTSLAIIEAGVSRQGEMAALEEMIRPDVAVVTAITGEHDSGFPSRAAKQAEKRLLGRRAAVTVEGPDGAGDDWQEADREVCRRVMRAMGYADDVIASRIAALPPAPDTRLEVVDAANDCQLVCDNFTCDTLSLPGALEFMRRRVTPGRRLAAVIGEIDNPAEARRLLHAYGVERAVMIGAGGDYPDADAFLADLPRLGLRSEMVLLKGQPGQRFAHIVERLERKQHETVLEVNLDAIVRNYNTFRSFLRPETGVVAMVKAFGYGAGSFELARTLQDHGAAYLAVAAHDEGVDLRQAGITMPIMVLNPRVSDYAALFDYRLEPEVYSFQLLDDIIAEAERRGVTGYPVHIKLDTGMHRLGFLEQEMEAVARAVLRGNGRVTVASAFSHLCCADDPAEDDYTLGQLHTFERATEALRRRLGYPFKRHILNTAGIVRFTGWQFDMVRLGIGLYGLESLPADVQPRLQRAASLRSVVIAVRRWPAGTTVGYNRRGRLKRDSVVATVPIGYADGLDRHLGYGNLRVSIGGCLCPTVGSICMDVMMVDVTDVAAGVSVGDRVEVFGNSVPTEMVAQTLGTIPYEVQTAVASRVKRVYFRE